MVFEAKLCLASLSEFYEDVTSIVDTGEHRCHAFEFLRGM